MISFLSKQFNWYGFFIGLAIVAVLEIFQQRVKNYLKKEFIEKDFWKLTIATIFSGVVGGRLWHVATDWHLYGFDLVGLQKTLFFWEGGMSILGAVLFGLLGLKWAQKRWFPKLSFLIFADALILGLPLGQAIGRLGNWVNQELYGLPTNLPWGIYINPENRVPQFLSNTHFHPLFAYEALLMLGAFVAMRWALKNKKIKLGEGKLTIFYLFFYVMIRFLLDFLRVQKSIFIWALGLNQVILMLIWFVGWLVYFFKKYFWDRNQSEKTKGLFKKTFLILATLIFSVILFGKIWDAVQLKKQHQMLLSLPDHSIIDFKVTINRGWGEKEIRVEVVNTKESISKGLGGRESLGEYLGEEREIDGMLFVFPNRSKPIFWMKDMNFVIDILWLNNNEVVDIKRKVLPPDFGEKDINLSLYSPPKNINLVLETLPNGMGFK